MKINKQDWMDYMIYLSKCIKEETDKNTTKMREMCIRNYNLSMIHADLGDAKLRYVKSRK